MTIWNRSGWLYERQKAMDDERPRAVYMEPGVANNMIHLWPVPESPAYDLILGTPVTFEAFADLTTAYPLQEGWWSVA